MENLPDDRPPLVERAERMEREALGRLVADPSRLLEARAILSPADWSAKLHRLIYGAMCELDSRGTPVDLVTLREELTAKLGAKLGGEATRRVLDLAAVASHGAQAEHFCEAVAGHSKLRRLLGFAEQIQREVPSVVPETDALSELLSGLSADLYEITKSTRASRALSINEAVSQALAEMDSAERHSGQVGLRTGFYDLDDMVCGLRPGNLIIVGARPSMGKTAFALNVTIHAARTSHHHIDRQARTMFFSLEMLAPSLAARALSCEAQIDGYRIKQGRVDAEETLRLSEAASTLRSLPLILDDTPRSSIHVICGKARREAQTNGLDLVVVDYVQLVQGSGRYRDRYLEVGEIGRRLKELSTELRIPVIALAQLSRKVEDSEKKIPRISHLRESGDLEQDADVILLLHRPHHYSDAEDETLATVICGKNREGGTGTIELGFRAAETRFYNRGPEMITIDGVE